MTNFSNTQLIESLAPEIGENIELDVSKWALFFRDADLHTLIAQRTLPLLENNSLSKDDLQEMWQNIRGKIEEGKTPLPLDGNKINFPDLFSERDLPLLDLNPNLIVELILERLQSETIIREQEGGDYIGLIDFGQEQTTDNSSIIGGETQSTNTFDSVIGYGFVDASAAVAQGINQNPFPDAPTFGGGNDWNVNMVNAPDVWDQGYTGEGIVVAVLDTGVDRNHPDLFSNIWQNPGEIQGNGVDDDGNGYVDDVFGWNFVNNDNNTLDVLGHGTHVSGTIAGLNNGTGVTGIAYDAKIMPVKVLGDSGSGSIQGVTRGILYAVENGADVINLSLGSSTPYPLLRRALNYASSQGVIVVMAAGNESQPEPDYPAGYATQWGVAVGAVDNFNNLADFSNYAGSDPSLIYVTSPGVSIFSTVPNGEYESWNGTSMATPHVSGIVALMLQANPNLTDEQVRNILASTATNNPTLYDPQSSSSEDPIPTPLFSDGSDVEFPDTGDSLTNPVYRFYNPISKGHFFTINEEEKNTVLAHPEWGYTFEGVGFEASATPGDSLSPVYRFYNPISKGHFFTINEEEKNTVLAHPEWGYTFENIGFYAYTPNASLAEDIYRFYNEQSQGHFFTINEAERDTVLANPDWGYTFEGVGFEAGFV